MLLLVYPGPVRSKTGCPHVPPPGPVQPGAHLPHDQTLPGQGCSGGAPESGSCRCPTTAATRAVYLNAHQTRPTRSILVCLGFFFPLTRLLITFLLYSLSYLHLFACVYI